MKTWEKRVNWFPGRCPAACRAGNTYVISDDPSAHESTAKQVNYETDQAVRSRRTSHAANAPGFHHRNLMCFPAQKSYLWLLEMALIGAIKRPSRMTDSERPKTHPGKRQQSLNLGSDRSHR